MADETYLLIPDRVEEGDEGDTLQVAGPALQALQSATLKHSRRMWEQWVRVASGCRHLFSDPRQRGSAGVVGVPAGGSSPLQSATLQLLLQKRSTASSLVAAFINPSSSQ